MLDPRGRKGLMRVVRSLNDQGMTVVIITHFMEEAALADRVIVLDGGRWRASARPRKWLIDVDALRPSIWRSPSQPSFPRRCAEQGVPVIAAVTEEALAESVFSLFGSHVAKACGDEGEDAERRSAHDEVASQGSHVEAAAVREDSTSCTKTPASPAASTDGDVLIWLENVSFTYDAAEARRQRQSR